MGERAPRPRTFSGNHYEREVTLAQTLHPRRTTAAKMHTILEELATEEEHGASGMMTTSTHQGF